ncbi:MAG: arsenate reductase (glutaredoxin) [Roseovarius sp.]
MTTIWHNPRCSKSRQALALLEERGAEITIRRYLDEPPSLAELHDAQSKLGLPAIDMIRTGEAAFKEMGLSKSDPDEVLLKAMSEAPKLIERPVIFSGDKAVIGRPPEKALEVF